MPDKIIEWECQYCYERFDEESDCIAHEKTCEENPDVPLISVPDGSVDPDDYDIMIDDAEIIL